MKTDVFLDYKPTDTLNASGFTQEYYWWDVVWVV